MLSAEFEISVRRFAGLESCGKDLAGCVVDEEQERTARSPFFEPRVRRAIALDELAEAWAAFARLMRSRSPSGMESMQPGCDHGFAQGFTPDLQLVALGEFFGGKGRAKVRIVLSNKFNRCGDELGVQPPVRRLPASPRAQFQRTTLAVPLPEPLDLANRELQLNGHFSLGQPSGPKALQRFEPAQFYVGHAVERLHRLPLGQAWGHLYLGGKGTSLHCAHTLRPGALLRPERYDRMPKFQGPALTGPLSTR